MRSFIIGISFLYLLISGFTSVAQKTLLINDSLAANSVKLNVKMGSQWFGKIWKFSFGDYSVVSSKLGWTKTTERGNFLNTKTETKSANKFSFVLTNKAGDSSNVNAARDLDYTTLNGIQILPNVYIGDFDMHVNENFSAAITINNDTSDTWTLFLNSAVGPKAPGVYTGELVNGTKKIFVIPLTSDKPGENPSMLPAAGYEFMEDNIAIAAMQFYAGGVFGGNHNKVWLLKNDDPKRKMLLASAITAILQIKATTTGFTE